MKNNNSDNKPLIVETIENYNRKNVTDAMNKFHNNAQTIKDVFGKTIKSIYESGAEDQQQSLFEIEGCLLYTSPSPRD